MYLTSVRTPCPTALVVDDDPIMRVLARHILEREGFAVVTANDGAEALTIWRSSRVDVVLSDINMPKLNGIALREIITLQCPGAKVILMSSDKPPADVGCPFLPKPLSPATLVEHIRALADHQLSLTA